MFGKLKCKLGKHDRIRYIDKVDLVSGGYLTGPMFKIKKDHYECYRCKKML